MQKYQPSNIIRISILIILISLLVSCTKGITKIEEEIPKLEKEIELNKTEIKSPVPIYRTKYMIIVKENSTFKQEAERFSTKKNAELLTYSKNFNS
mgnify:FL=1